MPFVQADKHQGKVIHYESFEEEKFGWCQLKMADIFAGWIGFVAKYFRKSD